MRMPEVFSNCSAGTVLVLVGLGLLIAAGIPYLIQQWIVIPRVNKHFFALNRMRAERVRKALASSSVPDWDASISPPLYPFEGFVVLLSDGSINVAGQCFPPGQAFEVVARDESHIPRAKVSASRTGVFIVSHGQTFRCVFGNENWNVEVVDDLPS